MINSKSLTINNNNRKFNYKYQIKNKDLEIDYELELPTSIPTNEHCLTIMNTHQLPIYLKASLEECLEDFIKKETQSIYDEVVETILNEFSLTNDDDDDEISSYWENLYKRTYKNELNDEIMNLEKNSKEIKFTKLYHKLIHSELMMVILNKEREYMIEINDLITKRDDILKKLENNHQNKIDNALKMNNVNRQVVPDSYISQLALENLEQCELERSKLNSKIDNLKLVQKNEFSIWLDKLDSDADLRNALLNNYLKQQERQFSMNNYSNNLLNNDNMLQESYTIQLGAQLKTTHNLRLIKCDILDYARNRFNLRVNLIEPQTIQTAIQQFSNTSLCALVLLVDCNMRKMNKVSESFANICDQSTEFHFQTLDQQLMSAEECLKIDKSKKVDVKINDDYECNLNIGDFCITKHSNLSQVHVAFHLAYDDNLSRQRTDQLSSRHPIILGLRNILKVCFKYNITTITLPLLLSHEMTEEMTINWVMKRAELVLKCLKGFMIEFVQWGSLESRTLQFVLPNGLLEETFHSISNLIKTIFRESRVVNLS